MSDSENPYEPPREPGAPPREVRQRTFSLSKTLIEVVFGVVIGVGIAFAALGLLSWLTE